MSNLGAWHGSQELKDRIVARMRQHREADDFVQGVYQEIDPATALGYRGCAIGCALDKQSVTPGRNLPREPEDGWHREFQQQFGVPWRVAELIDDLFEALDAPKHAVFAVAALEAIPAGADLLDVSDQFGASSTGDEDDDSALLLRLLASAPTIAERREAAKA